jgi:prepilin-type N-terminal cleavage/methylation domain-containing protein
MQKGFTVTELLIVIVVIGIIAGLTVAGYSTFQKRAYDASVQSDLESISGQLEGYRVRIDSSSPNVEFPRTTTVLETLEIQASKTAYDTTIPLNMIYCLNTTGTEPYQAYKLVARSKSGAIFMMTQDGFQTHSLTASNLTSGLCATFGMSQVSNGMSSAGVWQTWVRNS